MDELLYTECEYNTSHLSGAMKAHTSSTMPVQIDRWHFSNRFLVLRGAGDVLMHYNLDIELIPDRYAYSRVLCRPVCERKNIRVTLRLATQATYMTPNVGWVAEWSGLYRRNNPDARTIIFALTELSSLAKSNITWRIKLFTTIYIHIYIFSYKKGS
jgi:hypothetical protein